MTAPKLYGGLAAELTFVGRSCSPKLWRQKPSLPIRQRRFIGLKYIQKTKDAKEAWDQQAAEIEAGKQDSMLKKLEDRGYIHSVVGDRTELETLINKKRVGVYVGIDPTAPSLHVGHLLPLMALFWMFVHGIHALTLLGGSTARIGDPTGRTTTRELPHSSIRKGNMVAMHYQLKIIWANMEHHARFKHGYKWEWAWRRELVNNNTWFNKLPAVEILKLLGNGMRIGTMLGRDTVKNRLNDGDGMSFSEFTYPLLQAWDWWHMYHTKNIQLQIGGSDQYGNIRTGIDAINHIRKTHNDPDVRQEDMDDLLKKPMGFTVPLLTTASGEKFGKSAGNAVWLDREMTSPFELYQFFLRTADADVARYLRFFTFVPLPEITQLMATHEQEPSKRVAQRRLALEVVQMIHGDPAAKEAETQTRLLFPGTKPPPAAPTPIPADNPKNVPFSISLNPEAPVINAQYPTSSRTTLPRSLVYNQPIARVLFAAGLVSSRSEGHRLASNQGAYIGGSNALNSSKNMGDGLSFRPIVNWMPAETEKYVIGGELLVLRVGKWNIKMVRIIPDEEFDAQGLDAPGWTEWKEGHTVFADEEKAKRTEEHKNEDRKRGFRANLEQAKTKRRITLMDEAETTRYQDFLREGYRARNPAKAPGYAEWLRREAELKDKGKKAGGRVKASDKTFRRVEGTGKEVSDTTFRRVNLPGAPPKE